MKTSPCIRHWRGPILRFFGIKINTVNIYLIGSIGLYCTKFRRRYSQSFDGLNKVSETVFKVIHGTLQSFRDGMHSYLLDFTKFQRRYAQSFSGLYKVSETVCTLLHSYSVDLTQFQRRYSQSFSGLCKVLVMT